MATKGAYTKSKVFVYESYKDNLIIDRYHPSFQKTRAAKLKAIRSENSEDAITWNVFRTLQKIDSSIWLPKLFQAAFGAKMQDINTEAKISLWRRISSPDGIPLPEGKSEIDIIIETDSFVWFIEAKYKSDVSQRTRHDPKINQILRNIDVGTHYAAGKDFYFSLLILNEKYSANGIKLINSYTNQFETLHHYFPYRDVITNLKKLSLMRWWDFIGILKHCMEYAEYEDERFMANLAYKDLEKRLNSI